MSQLASWPMVPLERLVFETQYGTSSKANDKGNGQPIIRMNNLTYEGNFDISDLKWVELPSNEREKLMLQQGDLLFNRTNSRELVGKTGVWNGPDGYTFAGYLIRVRLRQDIVLSRWVAAFMNSPAGKKVLFNMAKPSINMANISASDLLRLHIPVAPIDHQVKTIALLDKADAIQRKRKQAIALTDQLLRSTFLEMFGDPVTNPKGWPEIPFGALVSETQLGLVRAASEQGPDLPYQYIRMNAIEDNGKLNLADLSRVDASSEDVMKIRLKEGDFLFNTRNTKELVGKSAVFHGKGLYLFNNNILRVRFRDEYDPDYICSYFQTNRGKAELERRKSGTTSVFAVYQRSLNEIPILMPPSEMQRKYSSVCSRVRSIADKLQTSLCCTTSLIDSLVSRAFRGELRTSNQFERQLSMFNK